jgi:hypothetical protein
LLQNNWRAKHVAGFEQPCQVLGGLLLGETQRQTRLRDCPRLSLSIEWAMGVLFKSWSHSLLFEGPERFNPDAGVMREWPPVLTLMLATKAAFHGTNNDNKIHYKTVLKSKPEPKNSSCFFTTTHRFQNQVAWAPSSHTRPENCSAAR